VTLVRAAKALEGLKLEDEDEAIGVNIVRRALEEPLRKIAENAGREGAVIVERVKAEKAENVGFNAETEQFEDLVKAGVIDPAKVSRTALQNAASIAALMLTTEALISEIPEEKKAPAMPPGGGGMGEF
jgi:chaperonin GroEL